MHSSSGLSNHCGTCGVVPLRRTFRRLILRNRFTVREAATPYLAINDRYTTQCSDELPGIRQKTIIGLTLLGSSGQTPQAQRGGGGQLGVSEVF
jgi:hypothetical protein